METQGKGSVLATEAVETQGKGSVLATEGSGNTRQKSASHRHLRDPGRLCRSPRKVMASTTVLV